VKQKYITAGVCNQISLPTQMLIWQLAASLPLEADYLQVFRLEPGTENGKTVQIVRQSQEVPEFQRTIAFFCEEPICDKLFLMRDGDDGDETEIIETLLLAEEY
jgi:hypothetical protein